MILVTLFFGVLLRGCSAIILTLNESEYAKLPPLYALEDFDGCVADRSGVYCVVDAVLHGDNQLMHTLQEYSKFTQQHFNHTVIHRGVCASRCGATNDSTLELSLTRCLNQSLWTSHQLQATVSNVLYCQRHGDQVELNGVDLFVAVVYLVILALNVLGTAYDLIFCNEEDKLANPYLLAFSIRRNWRHLAGGGGAVRDPRFDALKLFNGLRTMTMICVFFSHTTLIMSYSYVSNPLFIETSYSSPLMQLLLNGSLVTHTFFVMSAFLLAYNYLVLVETRRAGWALLPRGLLLRWFRLTPAYAVVLAGTATWLRAMGGGPLWALLVTSEAAACRRWWWAHLLYVNNYVYDDALCAPQTWYLAADTQMFAAGLLLCVCTRSGRARLWALAAAMLAAVAVVAAQTYWQDLDAVVIQAPERSYRELYAHDDTFRTLYARGHSNLPSYVLGLAAGFLAYAGQKRGLDLTKYRRWRFAYWLLVPLAILVILSGGIWYGGADDDGDVRTGTPATRALYAALYKPAFQFLVVVFILGAVFKFESVYHGIVSWRGWTVGARLAYCAFLLHTTVQRALLGTARQPTYVHNYHILVVLSATIFLSFGSGAILWLMVEAPGAALIKAVTSPAKPKDNSQL